MPRTNTQQTLASSATPSLLYFVMEFIEGTDVQQLIASEGQIDPKRAVQITCAVCDALAFAHEEGIIHRDIKPSNVMIDKKGRVKVADFGLAKALNLESTVLTGTNVAMGTPDFIAPEAMIAGTLVDQRADIYAVGVMLYEMLTGRVPRGRFDSPSAISPQVDKGFDSIVDKALQTDREKRYSTATELKREVESVAKESAIEGRAGTPARNRSTGGAAAKDKAGKSARAPLLIGMAVVIALGAGAFWMTRKDGESSRVRQDVAASPQGLALASAATSRPPAALGEASAQPAAVPDPVWHLPDGEPGFVKELVGHRAQIKGLVMLPDGHRVVSMGHKDGDDVNCNEVVLWDLAAGKPVWKQAVAPSRTSPLAEVTPVLLPSRDEVVVIERGAQMLHFLSLSRGDLVKQQPLRPTPVKLMETGAGCAVTTSADGSRFAVLVIPPFKQSPGPVHVQAFSASGDALPGDWTLGSKVIAVTGFDWLDNGRVIVGFVEAGAGKEEVKHAIVDVSQPESAPVYLNESPGIEFFFCPVPEGRELLGHWGATLAIYDLEQQRRTRVLPDTGVLRQFAFLDAQHVLGLSEGGTPRSLGIWNLKTGAQEWKLGDERLYDRVVVSPDGRLAVTNVLARRNPDVASPNLALWRLPKTGASAGGRAAAPAAAADSSRVRKDVAASAQGHTLASAAAPATATKDAPFTNTLGMKFVPVPITGGPTDKQRVLFSVWETRVQDYEVFAKETKREWPKPPFEQGPTHPAVMVSWQDAKAFCAWLTEMERNAGKIGAADEYRLPSDHEWSCAVGIGDKEDANQPPHAKQQKVVGVYPWGGDWPPPGGTGNYHDEAAKKEDVEQNKPGLDGFNDGWAWTAPAGSFSPSAIGLYDLSGNAGEWCEDWIGETTQLRVVRGGVYAISDPKNLLSSYRMTGEPDVRNHTYGFRIVLLAVAPTSTINGPHWPHLPTEEDKKLAFTNTLGMKFVPVPGTEVLFCIHETRNADYGAYAAANPEVNESWQRPERAGARLSTGADYPVTMVNWDDACAFCRWLSHEEGRTYRLPTDHEWSAAVGIAAMEKTDEAPTLKSNRFPGIYPWGTQWPPPKGAGNLADTTAEEALHWGKMIPGYTDGFATTAPVMSFEPNPLGLYDLAGNVFEWCEDWHEEGRIFKVARGGSYENALAGREGRWNPSPVGDLLASRQKPGPLDMRNGIFGFRVVAEKRP